MKKKLKNLSLAVRETKNIFLHYEPGKVAVVSNYPVQLYRVIVPEREDQHAVRPHFLGSYFQI